MNLGISCIVAIGFALIRVDLSGFKYWLDLHTMALLVCLFVVFPRQSRKLHHKNQGFS